MTATGELMISDMRGCLPGSSLSERPRYDRWNLVHYETQETAGVGMYVGALFAVPAKAIPDVTLPLKASGWHAIHLGLWDPFGPGSAGHAMHFRLSRDEVFQKVCFDVPLRRCADWPNRRFRSVKLGGKRASTYPLIGPACPAGTWAANTPGTASRPPGVF